MKKFNKLQTFILLIVYVFLTTEGCQKKQQAPTNSILFSSSIDDVYTKTIDQLQTLGFSISDLDKTNHKAKTDWKNIDVSELQTLASLKDDPQRYQKGRYAYQIAVEGDDTKATLTVDALVESLYVPSQREGDKFGTDKHYRPEVTNGTAEKNFITQIQQ